MLYAEPAGKQQLSMKTSDLARRAPFFFSRDDFSARCLVRMANAGSRATSSRTNLQLNLT